MSAYVLAYLSVSSRLTLQLAEIETRKREEEGERERGGELIVDREKGRRTRRFLDNRMPCAPVIRYVLPVDHSPVYRLDMIILCRGASLTAHIS